MAIRPLLDNHAQRRVTQAVTWIASLSMRSLAPFRVSGLLQLLLALAACRTERDAVRPALRQEPPVGSTSTPGPPSEPPGCVPIHCPIFPQVDTSVVAVDLERTTIVLAAGRDAGVEPGFVFDVYRGATYKGQVRVQRVEEDWSEGTILHSKKPIEPGDAATTRL